MNKEKEDENEAIDNENKNLEEHILIEVRKHRLKFQSLSWFDSTKQAILLKLESFLKSIAISISIFFLIIISVERNFGAINLMTVSTNTNRFFLALAFGLLFLYF